MKRVRENQQEGHDLGLERSIAIANYLLMLSHGTTTASTCQTSRVFECKTCNRQFPSFQALGGHRASHKKPKHLSPPPSGDGAAEGGGAKAAAAAKTHECTICGLEFGVGQALGGHMRRHRANLPFVGLPLLSSRGKNSNKNINLGGNYGYNLGNNRVVSLDLNLTPLENGLLEMKTFSSVYS